MNADSGRINWLHRGAPRMTGGSARHCPQGPLPLALAPWLELEHLEYQALDQHWAVVRMLANIDRELRVPADARLRVQQETLEGVYRPVLSVTEADGAAGSGLLWRASFGVPLEVVEYPSALFKLTASDGITLALPTPVLHLDGAGAPPEEALPREVLERHHYRRHARRHLVALASGFALAAVSGSAVAVADSVTTTTSTTTTTSQTTSAAVPNPPAPLPAPTSTTTTTSSSTTTAKPPPPPPPAPAPSPKPAAVIQTPPPAAPPTSSSHTTTSHPAGGATSTTPPPLVCKAPTILLTKLLAKEHRPPPPPGTKPLCVMPPAASTHHASKKGRKHKGKGKHHQHYPWVPAPWQIKVAPPKQGAQPSGGATEAPHKVAPAPRPAVDPDNGAFRTDASALSIASTGAYVDPFTAAQIERFSSLIGSVNQPPKYLVRIYKAAGRRYHVPWQVLGAINAIESDYGRNLSVSSAGAMGWMQFMPGTWLQYAVDASGNPQSNPYNPRDAIFTAARYLAANGAPRHMRKAIFAYNHALWYVDAVLWRAELISDRSLKHRRVHGYALPLDRRYMHQLGRTDDGVDIETAPDGTAVYSITPGVVTAVAGDPSGFGPNYPVVQVTKGPLAGQYIYYGHVAESLVHVGQHVLAGQPIAVMGHTGDAASLGHGHIEIGFSDASGAPLNQHGGASAWTPSGDAMRHVLVAISHVFRIKSA